MGKARGSVLRNGKERCDCCVIHKCVANAIAGGVRTGSRGDSVWLSVPRDVTKLLDAMRLEGRENRGRHDEVSLLCC
jgi:hypothetical protein